MYRVFLGAPTKYDLDRDPNSYQWQTISSTSRSETIKRNISSRMTQSASVIFPPATLEAASHRISLMYKNIIFDEDPDEQINNADHGSDEDFSIGGGDQTTLFTWPPTAEERNSRVNDTLPSFSLDAASKSHHRTASRFYGTQETQETQSYDYSDASSIGRFPTFHFSLHSLTSISSLSKPSAKGTKVSVLLAALEVEGPNTITIKKGADAGKEVSVLSMILGDADGSVCKLTAWREIADAWGGAGDTVAVKRGDILFIENVTATWDPTTSPTLSASPYLKSRMEICYRTMPYTHEDNRLRPDLRLGESDAAVRKVAAVANWFEKMAGLDAP